MSALLARIPIKLEDDDAPKEPVSSGLSDKQEEFLKKRRESIMQNLRKKPDVR